MPAGMKNSSQQTFRSTELTGSGERIDASTDTVIMLSLKFLKFCPPIFDLMAKQLSTLYEGNATQMMHFSK